MAEKAALPLIITDAGRTAAIDADHNGLQIELTEIAVGSGLWQPDSTATALQNEIKRITNLGAVDLASDMLHLTITDDTKDNYQMGEFGIYTNKGVLFAIYSQNSYISEKAPDSVFMLSIDISLETVPPDSVTITGNNFHYPPAQPDVLGVIYDAPHDSKNYIRKNGAWLENPPIAITTPTVAGLIYDAPHDGKNYIRKNGQWLEVPPQDNQWRPGDIKMFAGSISQIQSGWQLCNGSGTTSNGIQIPDLQDRMIVGSGRSYATGASGGATSATTNAAGNHNHVISVANTTLTVSTMPGHRHFSFNNDNLHHASLTSGNYPCRAGGIGNQPANNYSEYTIGGSTNDCVSGMTSNVGSNGAHNHSGSSNTTGNHSHTVSTMPPYYALAFIIKL